RANTFISIACCSALSLVLSGGKVLQAQAPPANPPSTGSSFQDSANELSVAVGKTVLVDCVRPASRVAVGLGDIATASVISPTEIMVNGKLPGETSLIIWDDRGGRQFFTVTVRTPASAMETSMDSIRRQLRTELPGQTLNLGSEN